MFGDYCPQESRNLAGIRDTKELGWRAVGMEDRVVLVKKTHGKVVAIVIVLNGSYFIGDGWGRGEMKDEIDASKLVGIVS